MTGRAMAPPVMSEPLSRIYRPEDAPPAATTDEVKDLRREARDLKEVVAEQTLELRLLKKA